MPDPMTAAKADLEERDRVKALAQDARTILNRLDGWQDWPRELQMDELLHAMNWSDAHNALSYIEWDDNRHDGETDP